MDKSEFLAQNPKENLWAVHQRQEAQEARLQELQQQIEMKTLGVSLNNQDDDLPHPFGLCRDPGCESCVSDAQEIAVAARRSAFEDVDKWLLAAGNGNEQVVAQVAQAIQLGKAKLEQVAAANKGG